MLIQSSSLDEECSTFPAEELCNPAAHSLGGDSE